MMRVGLYRPVHVKTLRSQRLRMLLTQRQLLQSKAIAIENDLRATLRNFGLKVGIAGRVKFEASMTRTARAPTITNILARAPLTITNILDFQLFIFNSSSK